MAAMREIRGRIKNADNMWKITKAMKMVSVSKLRKVQTAMEGMRPFTQKSQEIISALLDSEGGYSSPLIDGRAPIKSVCYVLLVGNRGLCGAFNNNLLHYMQSLVGSEALPYSVIVCGRWGRDIIKNSGLHVDCTFEDIDDTPGSGQGVKLAEYIKSMYLRGDADRVVIVYPKFINALIQIPRSFQLLPKQPELRGGERFNRDEYIFEPERGIILENAIQLYINSSVYSALLEAKAGEHASRMRAMSAASDNTKELITELRQELNQARQAAITTEISEIVGGASSLRKARNV